MCIGGAVDLTENASPQMDYHATVGNSAFVVK